MEELEGLRKGEKYPMSAGKKAEVVRTCNDNVRRIYYKGESDDDGCGGKGKKGKTGEMAKGRASRCITRLCGGNLLHISTAA